MVRIEGCLLILTSQALKNGSPEIEEKEYGKESGNAFWLRTLLLRNFSLNPMKILDNFWI
ncbi:MAG: hypothetical protein V3S16_10775 [Candidatus Desulfatibia sp.]|uniref:hypothetical protein n=1 Tax=Candidatus Desulfatibia sp. TaxID=3101189 RepID=UPI002F2E5371